MRTGLLALRAAGAAAVLVAAPVLGLGAAHAQARESARGPVAPVAVAHDDAAGIQASGCESSPILASSQALAGEPRPSGRDRKSDGDGGRDAAPSRDTRNRSSAVAGNHGINVRCDGQGHGRGRGRSGSGDARVLHHGRPTPFAPVRAGGGGAATLAADRKADVEETGPGIPQAVIGLVLASVAAVAVALRSARRQRRAPRDSD
ncbi:hypothetical protein [Streptomyces sp. AK02-01A]|uniref:hypothetical protein n=1 Tax=Streptomyces sp. AK02-01A TaxID=3028648 RepID=UPI0029A54DFB|nr:hypothetical protein [Streptomyces sp. AK02-01A]MDX3849163.1 hypothetical protein [Streptomyces sp. AK02-01A]